MTRSKVVRMLLVSLVILGLGLAVSPVAEPAPATGGRFMLSLQRPPFLSTVSAQISPDELDIGEYLDDEAGFAAWYETSGPIDLDDVRPLFCPDPDNCTIELETDCYIIGSIDLPNYPPYWDVHAYVHCDGWIVVYYLNTDLSSKILDVKAWTIEHTNLTTIVSLITSAAGYPMLGEKYYDFRNSSANRILLVAEDDTDGDCYTIWMPPDFAYAECTWAKYNNYFSGSPTFLVDGDQMSAARIESNAILGYPIPPPYCAPDVTHTVCVNATYGTDYGVLMVIYREFSE